MINDVAHDVTDPETKARYGIGSRRPGQRVRLARVEVAAAVRPPAGRTRRSFRSGRLGSGSDFAAFIDHLGITTVSLGFGGEDRGGTYHSAYDTPWYIEHFGDKESLYGKALADTAGTIVMRFADADVLPYDFRNLATTSNGYSAAS